MPPSLNLCRLSGETASYCSMMRRHSSCLCMQPTVTHPGRRCCPLRPCPPHAPNFDEATRSYQVALQTRTSHRAHGARTNARRTILRYSARKPAYLTASRLDHTGAGCPQGRACPSPLGCSSSVVVSVGRHVGRPGRLARWTGAAMCGRARLGVGVSGPGAGASSCESWGGGRNSGGAPGEGTACGNTSG